MRGADIRIKRRSLGIEQIELARVVRCNPNTLSDIENERIPDLEDLDKALDEIQRGRQMEKEAIAA